MESNQQQVKQQFSLQRIIIEATPQFLVLEQQGHSHDKSTVLLINRSSQKFTEKPDLKEKEKEKKGKLLYYSALLGVMSINAQKFLVLAKEVMLRCTILKKNIFSIEKVVFLQINNSIQLELEAQQRIDYLAKTLSKGFYFSFHLDLTLPLLKQQSKTRNSFNWLQEIQKPLEQFSPHWKMRAIQGYVGRFSIFVQGLKLKMFLISRRSVRRGGTRYKARGISDFGYVANYCQTQQIVVFDKYLFTYLQIRGSIPLFWKQSGIKKQIKIVGNLEENQAAFREYVSKSLNEFGAVLMINLLSEKKGQLKLLESLEYSIKNLPEQLGGKFNYVHYDVHLQCHGSKYEKANQFIQSKLVKLIHNYGFNCVNLQKNQRIYTQRGIVRTNCLDCLDRTNLVQSKLGALIFIWQLKHLSINLIHNKARKTNFQLQLFQDLTNPLVSLFRKVWVNNGDFISNEYAGTGSTHSAVNLQGKQTLDTMIDHGKVSLLRKFREFTFDDWKQSNLELFCGQKNLNGQVKGRQDQTKQVQDIKQSIDQEVNEVLG